MQSVRLEQLMPIQGALGWGEIPSHGVSINRSLWLLIKAWTPLLTEKHQTNTKTAESLCGCVCCVCVLGLTGALCNMGIDGVKG